MNRWPSGAAVSSAVGIALFQVVGSIGAADNQPERKAIDGLAIAFVLLGPVALAWRERWPLPVAVVAIAAADVYIAFGYPYGPVFVSAMVALFITARSGQRRGAWLVAAVGFAGYLLASYNDPSHDQDPGIGHFALVAGWLALVLTVGETARGRSERAAEREKAELDEKARLVAEQRLDLARELHDVLAHNISLINVQASVALHLFDEQPERARPTLVNIKEASREALHELRTALDLLRRGEDAPRSPAPRLAELDALVRGVRASGLEVRLHNDLRDPLPAAVELAAYRIVQEALTNVTRHAKAHLVTVHLSYDDGVRIEVIDDGVGGPAVPGNGIGGMGERALAVGGSVEAGPLRGKGFRVAAYLPAVPR